MVTIRLDLDGHRALAVDWFVRLAKDAGLEFTQSSWGSDRGTIGDPNGLHVVAEFINQPPWVRFHPSKGLRKSLVGGLARDALNRARAQDLGGSVWFSTSFAEIPLGFPAASPMSSLFSRLGSQVRIVGWRRLGHNILLEFIEEDTGIADKLLEAKATVRAHIAAPGPGPGRFASRSAHAVVETIAAICTLALGRAVSLPHGLFPTDDENVPDLEQKRKDSAILTLARKGVGLNIFSQVGLDGGLEIFRREQAALVTFDAAVQQERDSVAAILFTVAAEALTTPTQSWRSERLTKRFIRFFDELMSVDLDGIVAHANFEEAFGIARGARGAGPLRRDLLKRIYDNRSGHLHMGLAPEYRPVTAGGIDMAPAIRRALLADFAEAAILRFVEAPRASLVGHPDLAESPD